MAIKSLSSSSIENNVFYRSMLAGNEPYSPFSFWMQLVGASSADSQARGVVVDSNDNYYFIGYSSPPIGTGGYEGFIVKTDVDGNVQWNKGLGDNVFQASGDYIFGADINANDEIYVVGSTEPAANDWGILIAKYDTSGNVTWQRQLNVSGYRDDGTSIACSGTSYVYVTGLSAGLGYGSYDGVVVKYDTSGTVVWKKQFGDASNNTPTAVSVTQTLDRANVMGRGSYTVAHAMEIQSNGNLNGQGARQIGTVDYFQTSAWTSSHGTYGRTINAGITNGLTSYYAGFWVLMDPVGLADQVYGYIGDFVGETNIRGSAADADGNFYLVGYTQGAGKTGTTDGLIVKVNGSNGSVIWQRMIGESGSQTRLWDVYVNSDGNIVVTGDNNSLGNNYFFNAALPADGTLTGTYSLGGQNFVYKTSSLTTSSPTVNYSAYNPTFVNSSISDSATSLTNASYSPTTYTTAI